jgi:hypothetical protein
VDDQGWEIPVDYGCLVSAANAERPQLDEIDSDHTKNDSRCAHMQVIVSLRGLRPLRSPNLYYSQHLWRCAPN